MVQVSLTMQLGLYPFATFRHNIFLVSASEPEIIVDVLVLHIYVRLANAGQEKMASRKGVNGYNRSSIVRETCTISDTIPYSLQLCTQFKIQTFLIHERLR